jgi:hypothetical protein
MAHFTSYHNGDVTNRLKTFLSRHSFAAPELAILRELWDAPAPPASLIHGAVNISLSGGGSPISESPSKEWEITRDEAERAIVALFDRRLLQLINSDRRSRIARHLDRSRTVYYTADQIPQVGDVELSASGIVLIMNLYCAVFDWTETTECIIFDWLDDNAVQVCTTSAEYMKSVLPNLSYDHQGKLPVIEQMKHIKAWRDRWWRKRRHGVCAKLLWAE